MTFEELRTEVYSLTNRPDLVAETTSAIKAATLKAHQSDFYSKDIYETGVTFSAAAYNQSLDYTGLISNFRALKYIKRVESATDEIGVNIDILTPEEVVDSYGVNKTDICYIAGRMIEIKSSVEFQYMLLGCYVRPIVREDSYFSWVADQFPYAIAFEAARVIFKMIGYDEQSASFERLVAEQFAELRMSALADHAY